jgi:hypothetical protein
MKAKRENFIDCDYEEKLYRQANLARKVSYGYKGFTGSNETNPGIEGAVRHYEDNK